METSLRHLTGSRCSLWRLDSFQSAIIRPNPEDSRRMGPSLSRLHNVFSGQALRPTFGTLQVSESAQVLRHPALVQPLGLSRTRWYDLYSSLRSDAYQCAPGLEVRAGFLRAPCLRGGPQREGLASKCGPRLWIAVLPQVASRQVRLAVAWAHHKRSLSAAMGREFHSRAGHDPHVLQASVKPCMRRRSSSKHSSSAILHCRVLGKEFMTSCGKEICLASLTVQGYLMI